MFTNTTLIHTNIRRERSNVGEEVLLSLTEKNLETGLRGVPVGYCSTSFVDSQKGLHYRGYNIKDLAYKSPEEVIYLLLNSEFPTDNQLTDFKDKLNQYAKVDEAVLNQIKTFSKDAHPMYWFLGAINALGMNVVTQDWKEDALRIIASVPLITAAIFRFREGKEWIEPKLELGYMENFAHMLGVDNADSIKVLKIFDILHLDHGGGNLSTFVGKAIASGHADMFQSIIGAMAALAGPLHGKANQECLNFLKEAKENIQDVNNDEEVYTYIKNLFENGGKIFGFGHAVLRAEDPRATIQYEVGETIAKDDVYFQLSKTMRRVVVKFLSSIEKVSNPYPNVDAVSGALLNACGFDKPEYYTVLFGMSRSVGIAIQILLERTVARNGKGTPIVRPKYIYSGPKR